MYNFSTYITEAKTAAETTANRTHLEPPGFRAFDGHEHVGKADFHLREFHNYLLGKKSKVRVTTKYDGTPALHVGMDEDGKHIFAFKGMFNKNPKIFKTEEDVDKEYPTDHPLNHIMKQAMRHLPATMPKKMKPGQWFKGDVISVAGSDRSPKRENGFISTHPNVMKYKFPEDSQEGKELADSQIGIVWHTKFDKNGKASSITPKDRAEYSRSKEVFSLDPEVKANPNNYTPEEQNAFLNDMENARQVYGRIKPDTYDRLAGHNETLRTYLNGTFRSGEQPSFDGYMQHLTNKQKKDVDSVKTQAAKEKKMQAHAAFMQQAHENKKDVANLIELHGHLDRAKQRLVDVADKNSISANELPSGEATSGEGYVTDDGKGDAMKHVHDKVRHALLTGAGFIGKAKAEAKQPINSSYNLMGRLIETLTEAKSRAIVAHFGKWRIPHAGYDVVTDKVKSLAQQHGADHEIALSGASNPLSFDQKVKHARKMFPGTNITSDRHTTFLQHLSDLHRRGYREVHYVVGSDRVKEFKDAIERYNGKPDKKGNVLFNFDKVHIHQAGDEREEGASGVTGSSSTMQEKHAANNDFKSFAANSPRNAKPADVRSLFNDVRKNTKLNETTTAAVGGLGFNSGNPAATNDELARYADTNALASDQSSQSLSKELSNSQNKLSKIIGFKEYQPKMSREKALTYWDYDENGNPLLIDAIKRRAK